MSGENPIIQIISMDKTFQTKGGEVHALTDINLAIEKGDVFGIIGASGAGKSTLVRCINLLEKPTQGSILFDGKDLMGLSKSQLMEARRSMGMIFQQFNLLMQKTALDNICFPLQISGVSKAKAQQRAGELLELVGLSNRAKSYPAQLSRADKNNVSLSPEPWLLTQRFCCATKLRAPLTRRLPVLFWPF